MPSVTLHCVATPQTPHLQRSLKGLFFFFFVFFRVETRGKGVGWNSIFEWIEHVTLRVAQRMRWIVFCGVTFDFRTRFTDSILNGEGEGF